MPDLNDLLLKTSRTFGISIPILDEPLRRQVTIAYLLFRIADTFEDGDLWPAERRIATLREFEAMLGGEAADEAASARWLAEPPCRHKGYLELLGATPFVLGELGKVEPAARERIVHYTRRTIEGMIESVGRTGEGGQLRLRDIADLRRYCYFVAGIVGEMLTDLFLLEQPGLAERREELLAQSRLFGEGLQLVNILKDSADDALEGRFYLPGAIARVEVLALARESLSVAREYVKNMQRAGAPGGVMGFLVLPLVLAWATLERIEERGPGAKVGRLEVLAMLARVRARSKEGWEGLDDQSIEALYRGRAAG